MEEFYEEKWPKFSHRELLTDILKDEQGKRKRRRPRLEYLSQIVRDMGFWDF